MTSITVRASTRPWSRSGVRGLAIAIGLGCLWGIAEATLGTSLHVSRVPIAGQLLIPIGICCALFAYKLYPIRGIIIVVGALAAAIRLSAPGPFLPMPALAILLEAALMQSCVLCLGAGRVGCMAAGTVAASYPLLHAFVIKTLFFDLPLAAVYSDAVQQARTTLFLPLLSAPVSLFLWAVLSLIIGGASAFMVCAAFSLKRRKPCAGDPA